MIRPLALLAVILTACRAAPTATKSALAEAPIRITAVDFAFGNLPDTISSGEHTVRLVNTGREPHMVAFTEIDSSHTVADLIHAIAANQDVKWAVEHGGPQMTPPGDSVTTMLELPAGLYAVICWVPDSAGRPHVALGMIKALEVVPDTAPSVAEPVADDTLATRSFTLAASHPLTTGAHVLRVDNVDGAGVNHDVLIVRLRPGHTVDEAMTWLDSFHGSPATFDVVGGTTGIPPGQHVELPLTLINGQYAVLCIMPDSAGKGHFRHGMVTTFAVE
jgi:plastocyanin